METVKQIFQVDKFRIGFLKFIFEAHEGLAVITTLDAAQGIVRFAIAPGCEAEVHAVVEDLQKDMRIDEV